MSYDIDIIDREANEIVTLTNKHHLKGGTYPANGTNQLSFNITYNYSPNYAKHDFSINDLNNKTIKETLATIRKVKNKLKGKPSDNYWEPSDGNAKKALQDLITMASFAKPKHVWLIS